MKNKFLAFMVLAILLSSFESPKELGEKTFDKKQGFLNLLGDLPVRGNVETTELANKEFERYTRKLIQYTVAGDTTEAYVLIPKKIKGIVPGILSIHQDGEHRPYEYGKGEPAGVHGDTALFYGLELCLRGFVVICPDRFGFESRMLKKSGYWKDFSPFSVSLDYYNQKIDLTEDLYMGAKSSQLITEGKTMLGKTLSELMYAVDILCSMDEVDDKEIGVIGHLAGGFLSEVLMYVDNRIGVGVSSCGSFLISDFYNSTYLRPMNGFAGLLTIPGIIKWGALDDVMEGIYPRPFLELSGDIDRSKVFEKALKKQREGEVKNSVECRFYNLGKHTPSKEMREEAHKWIETWTSKQTKI